MEHENHTTGPPARQGTGSPPFPRPYWRSPEPILSKEPRIGILGPTATHQPQPLPSAGAQPGSSLQANSPLLSFQRFWGISTGRDLPGALTLTLRAPQPEYPTPQPWGQSPAVVVSPSKLWQGSSVPAGFVLFFHRREGEGTEKQSDRAESPSLRPSASRLPIEPRLRSAPPRGPLPRSAHMATIPPLVLLRSPLPSARPGTAQTQAQSDIEAHSRVP